MESRKVSVVSPLIEKLFGYIGAALLLAGAKIANTVKARCGSNPRFDDIDW